MNPVAGLGGPAGLKGSDTGWQEALQRGIEPQAHLRAARFLRALRAHDPRGRLRVVCLPGALGVDGCDETLPSTRSPSFGQTTAQDTRQGAQALVEARVDIVCFVGGDGTATDVADAIGTQKPALGIPAGVKVTSPVFAHDPEEAAHVVATLEPSFETVERDVTDLDEAAYQQGRLDVRLTGSLRVPVGPAVQAGKTATVRETPLGGIVDTVLSKWDEEALWFVGAGSVCRAVKKRFYGQPTLLGVDAILGDRIIASDLDATRSRELVRKHGGPSGRPVRVLLSPIGGQGVLIGRGTQVLPPDVLAAAGWSGIVAMAPPEKLAGVRGLWVDSGDAAFDAQAPRHLRVVVGWNETRVVRLLHGGGPEP